MRIFDGQSGRINFVDENNVLVGYDMTASCCEDFGWALSIESSLPYEKLNYAHIGENGIDPEGYNFDPVAPSDDVYQKCFRLTNENDSHIYLILWNDQNGYYDHGFDMKKDDKTLFEGNI